ncbi:Hepcidin [Galemys pyrenaicus]|uniref:Hepcidin n=1 Tax=Galemys pyrenaicus TaxID=202257 RepID=A0A8J6AMZ9_GALPY|nr:Hepcidin [Galemys pyrenaicus]
MAQSTRTQAACLLLLLLTGLASGSVLRRQTRQPAQPQTQDMAGAEAGWTPETRRLWRRDTHFPICMFCCSCCPSMRPNTCGFCCKS